MESLAVIGLGILVVLQAWIIFITFRWFWKEMRKGWAERDRRTKVITIVAGIVTLGLTAIFIVWTESFRR